MKVRDRRWEPRDQSGWEASGCKARGWRALVDVQRAWCRAQVLCSPSGANSRIVLFLGGLLQASHLSQGSRAQEFSNFGRGRGVSVLGRGFLRVW
jgi:hypothetical protein